MSLWGKLAGAAAGLAIGGPIGAMLGGLAGHFALDRGRKGDGEQPSQSEVAFTVGVIALGAKMAKADGLVTPDEIEAFKDVFKVPQGEIENVARIFNLAKQDVAGYEAYARQLAEMFKDNRQLLEDVLEGLFHIATADGVLHEKEEDYLKQVAKRFGFTKDEYKSVRARFLPEDQRSPYRVLGVASDISDDELKAHYRRLVLESHPDRAIARGMPPEFIKIANEKIAAINEAYDEIRRSRGL
ncbi:MAG: TerB family tellurite resistance protein [Hyphomicrobiaceae bacterium]